MNQVLWHSLSISEILAVLQAAPAGLTSAEAARRLAEYGPNELPAPQTVSAWTIAARRLIDVPIILALMAAALAALIGQSLLAIVVVVVACLLFARGVVKDYRAQRAAASEPMRHVPTAHVLRDGQEVEVPAHNLVPGDIILLRAGDRIPADARLIEAITLRTEESALTARRESVAKDVGGATDSPLPLHARENMVFAGAVVVLGMGRAIVVATGAHTEFARLTQSHLASDGQAPTMHPSP